MPTLPTIEITRIESIEVAEEAIEQNNLWAEYCSLQISEGTRATYSKSIADFFERELDCKPSAEAIAEFLQLKEEEAILRVLQYRKKLIDGELAAATINVRLNALKGLVKYAAKQKKCDWRLDEIKPVKAQNYKDTRGISIEEFKELISHINRKTATGKRDYAILRLLWDNGLRRGEIAALNIEDFDATKRRLKIRGKGKIDKEYIDLANTTTSAIEEAITDRIGRGESPKAPLFTTQMNERITEGRIYKMLDKLGKKAKLNRQISPHRIRHSSITALLDLNGGDVRSAQAHSRHKKVETLLIYDDNRKQMQGKSAQQLADAID